MDYTEDKIREIRDRTVIKANDLIQKSRFDLSLIQQKIIIYLISQIKFSDTEFKLYSFPITEFCKVCGIDYDSGGNYAYLKKTIQDISNKSMWIMLDDNRETLIRWIEKPYINYRSGTIQIKLDNDMKPFLLQLKERYTQYELIYALNFKSKYSIRLYELIKSIHYHELEEYSRTYEVEEIRRLLGAGTYHKTKDFKARSINPAVKEINEFSDIDLQVDEIKQGKKITHFCFTVKPKPIVERFRIRAEIEKEMGMEQLTLWDKMKDR